MTTVVLPSTWTAKSNPHHDNLGRFSSGGGQAAIHGGPEGGVTLRLTAVPGSAPFDGRPVPQKTVVAKGETGRVAEEAAKAWLFQNGSTDVRTAEMTRNNFPIDVAHDHQAVEVKGGRIDTGIKSQKWGLTIGEPGKAEKAELARMTAEEKAAHNQRKVDAIFARKQEAMRELSARLGAPVSPRTITAVVNHDDKTVHLYSFEGFHKRIGWTSPAARAAYVGTFRYEDLS